MLDSYIIYIYIYIICEFEEFRRKVSVYYVQFGLCCSGFFVTIWIAAVMFKSNDILRKQAALKVRSFFGYNFTTSMCVTIQLSTKCFLTSIFFKDISLSWMALNF
jgi:hypothetical protein